MEAQTMITTHSAQATRGLGQQIGGHLADGDAVCLSGELGAGKTHFIQGLAHGWGALEPVTSPTYTLLNTYTRQKDTQRFYHLDCYRLAGPEDAVTLAFDDILDAPGVLVIEWAERIEGLLPEDCLWIGAEVTGETDRQFTFWASGPRALKLLEAVGDSH